MVFLFIPNIYFSSKLVAVTNQEGKEEIRPSKTEVESSIFNVRTSDPHDRDVNVLERDKSLLTDPFYMLLLWARCTNNFLRSAQLNYLPYSVAIIKRAHFITSLSGK